MDCQIEEVCGFRGDAAVLAGGCSLCDQNKISEVNENGPWVADYLEWYFLSTANDNRYKLAVETFHGAGGYWKQLD